MPEDGTDDMLMPGGTAAPDMMMMELRAVAATARARRQRALLPHLWRQQAISLAV